MVTADILSKAAASFDFDVNTLEFVSHSTNEVYRFSKNNEYYFLRISAKPLAYAEKIHAELEWVHDLVHHGVNASMPILTKDQQLTAVYEEDGQCFIAAVFCMAPGKFFDKGNPHLWGTDIYHAWGETMGKMHKHSKSYKPLVKGRQRDHWSKSGFSNPNLQRGKYRVLLEKLQSIEDQIDSLPRNDNGYGLIHNDFHPYNFMIDGDTITVFDFDDCIYGWYALDIAIASAHAVWWGSPGEDRKSKNEFSRRFLDDFLAGYFKHHQLDSHWIQRIPLFMDYRNICSFFWWLQDWDGDESQLNDFQKDAITEAVKIIADGRSFDGCEIEM
ncbi:phosphotransferase enzyme family protein [Paenibacillus sp. S28]|uniref:phosphotransferase enzyme family protein n=1 Tax=Paenibacillus sp. S28 TaxID=2767463 RepID=UPI00190CA510|nr:phosphotransferase [Paenibacillus sp. S28]MBJ9987507.1 phosphotransferase [Paenibacillus sp. S28]